MGKDWDDSHHRAEMHIVFNLHKNLIGKEKGADIKLWPSMKINAGESIQTSAKIKGKYLRLQDIENAKFYWKHETDKKVIRLDKMTAIFEKKALSFCSSVKG